MINYKNKKDARGCEPFASLRLCVFALKKLDCLLQWPPLPHNTLVHECTNDALHPIPLRADETRTLHRIELVQPLLEGWVVRGANGRVLKAERHQWQSG